MTFRSFLKRCGMGLCALIVLCMIAEGLLRTALFHGGDAFRSWRHPEWYTQVFPLGDHTSGSDDRDKMRVRWGLLKAHSSPYHPMLGWCGLLDTVTLLPHGHDDHDPRVPIVMLGSSWCGAEEEARTIEITRDAAFTSKAELIDLAVHGFGPDQDLLLLRSVMDRLQHPLVLWLVDPTACDLVERHFPGRPKPWCIISGDHPGIFGIPVPRTALLAAEEDPPHPGSYLYHLLANRLSGDSIASHSATLAREDRMMSTCLGIFSTVLDSSRAHGAHLVVLINDTSDNEAMRARCSALIDRCTKAGTPYRLISQLKSELGTDNALIAARRELALWATDKEHQRITSEWVALNALRNKPEKDRTELERMLVHVLDDRNWFNSLREKAATNHIDFPAQVYADAQYVMGLQHKGSGKP